MGEPFDFQSRYASVFRYVVFAIIVMGVAWFVGNLWAYLNAKSKLLSCQNQIKQLGIFIQQYRDDNGNQMPQWLTQLSPNYVKDPKLFICPMDRSKGAQGCFPRWLENDPDWRDELKYADLDGPSQDPRKSDDNIPCSYFYRFNHYPSDASNRRAPVWSEIALTEARTYKEKMPVVQCFWHLDEGTQDDSGKVPSLLYDLIKVEIYPKKWKTQVER